MKKTLFFTLFLFSYFSFVYSKSSDFVIFNANELQNFEKTFFDDIDDGKLDRHTNYDAFLIASGINDEKKYINYQKDFAKLKKNLESEIKNENLTDKDEISKKILKFLHQNYLKEYKNDSSYAQNILAQKTYNALSSSILFSILASDFGISVRIVQLPTHFYVIANNQNVETTHENGFNPTDEIMKQILAGATESDKKSLNLLEAMSLLFLTRGNENFNNENFKNLKKGFYFANSPIFVNNLVGHLNNLSIEASNKKDHSKALKYVNEALKITPNDENLQNNLLLFYTLYIQDMLDKESIELDKILTIYKEGCEKTKNKTELTKNVKKLFIRKISNLADKQNYEIAKSLCDFALSNLNKDEEFDATLTEFSIKLKSNKDKDFLNQVLKLVSEKKFNEASKMCEDKLKEKGLNVDIKNDLDKILNSIQMNIKIDLYNKIVADFYSKNKDVVLKMIDEALKMIENKELDEQLQKIKKMLQDEKEV